MSRFFFASDSRDSPVRIPSTLGGKTKSKIKCQSRKKNLFFKNFDKIVKIRHTYPYSSQLAGGGVQTD